jgi:hypothetical protein
MPGMLMSDRTVRSGGEFLQQADPSPRTRGGEMHHIRSLASIVAKALPKRSAASASSSTTRVLVLRADCREAS